MEQITAETLAERYAAMSDAEFAALDPRRLTPEAAEVYAAEAAKRGTAAGVPSLSEQELRFRARAEAVRKKRRRQFIASALLLLAVLVEHFSERLPESLMDAKSVAVAVLAVLAVVVLKKR